MSDLDLNFQKNVTLKNGRQLLLRYPLPKDIDSLLQFTNDIVKEQPYICLCQQQTYESELEYLFDMIKKIRQNKEIHLAAYDKNIYVGKADITQTFQPRQEHVGRLGISLAPQVRGQGLGKLLIEEVISQAQNILKLKLIILDCFAPNTSALMLYKKIGFQDYGLLPASLSYQGKFIDKILMYKQLIWSI